MQFVLNDPKFLEVCEKVVNTEPWLLVYVLGNLKTQEMCKKVVKEGINMLQYVPDQYITQEMCNKARICPWQLCDIPDQYNVYQGR